MVRKFWLPLAALAAVTSVGGCSATLEQPEVGMCFNLGANKTLNEQGVKPIPCDEPHQCEVVGIYQAVGGPYPSAETLTREAHDFCVARFEYYVGFSAAESVFDLSAMVPTESAWENGDTDILCLAQLPDGSMLTRSVEGATQ